MAGDDSTHGGPSGTRNDPLADTIDPSFRSVAEGVADNIILLDPDGRIRYINYTVPDLTVEQVLGTSVYGYVPEEYREAIRRCHVRVLESAQPDRYETAYVSDQGEVSWWESRVSPVVRHERVVGLVQISSNVTERRQAAAERDRLFNLSLDMLCVAGTDGYFKRINPAFSHTLGHGEEELLSRPFIEFVHPDDRAATLAEVARLARGEQGIDFDNRYRCRDGSYRWISWRGAPDTTGKLIYAIGRDVTERRELEEQLRRSQKMETVGQLAGGIAHDFNNLVLAIDLNVNLAMRASDDAKREHYCSEVHRATQRAADLTRQLLALGRKPRTTLEAVDLAAIVRGMSTLLHRLIPASIEIELEAASELPSIQADPGQVEQVILNLCLNARDAMPEGGRLLIAIERAPAGSGQERVSGTLGDRVVLRVTDSGIGMSAEVREHAFEPFFTTKPFGQGTGLGLATVYGIVDQHGGSVRIESELGRGTTFEVLWPTTTERPRKARDVRRGEVVGGRETILVAEDEPGVRSGVVETLERAGYTVLAACDGEEAVRIFEANDAQISLVLLDVVMPKLGGPLAGLRMRARRPGVPIVLTSGYDYAAELGESTIPNAARLDKPYALDDLLRVLRQELDRRR